MRTNWGGKRIGSGRKKKPKAARVLAHPSSAQVAAPQPAQIDRFSPSEDLTPEERAVWDKQAPHAFEARTLTAASALAFERYCKVVVLERNEAKGSGVAGSNHRGLLKQLQAYELHFMLIPSGKPMAEAPEVAQPQVDENDAFFGDAGVSGA